VGIRERILALEPLKRERARKRIRRNRSEKENRRAARCPFLEVDRTCLIYNIRPFSCRQLYSLRPCDARGPLIERRAHDLSRASVSRLQRIDDTGYSGHISYVLHLLDDGPFRALYLSGGFDPGRIVDFGKSHGIVINRIVSPPARTD
jgi:uncharacterized protein